MVFAGDQWVQLPVRDLYDTGVMQMALAAAKDMYDKGQKQIEDFYTKYGDFMSPFAKDMQRYNDIVGGVGKIIDQAYANGIDVLRSPEGRSLVAQAIRSVNPAEINAMKANAKMGYAYQDALQALRRAGKYSQEQEDFDIAQNGGTAFQDFATRNDAGGFNAWDRSSPIQATTLRDLTYDSYKGRTPRTLTKEDFEKDPRLAGKYKFDPRYEWTGFLYSDLLKNAPGASAALAGDTRADFFRDQAKQKVIAAGLEPTKENIEKQFRSDIAAANSWALVDPVRKADQFALLDQQHRNAQSNIYLQNRLAADRENEKMKNQIRLQLLKNQGKSKYKSLGSGNNDGSSYSVTNEVHLDGIYNQLKHLGIKIPRLVIKNGKIMRQVDKNGNQLYRDIDDASEEELKYAAAHKNELLRGASGFMNTLRKAYGKDYLNNETAMSDFVSTYGYKISAEEAAAFLKNKKLADNGGIVLSGNEIKNMHSLKSIMAGTFNSGRKYSSDYRLQDVLASYLSDKGGTAYKKLTGNDKKSVDEQWIFDSTSDKNIISRPNGRGGTEVFLKGTAKIKWGDTKGDIIEVEQWLPIGLVSEIAAKKGKKVKASDFELRGENRAGYKGIDAGYLKATGSQKRANIALTDDGELDFSQIGDMDLSQFDSDTLTELLKVTYQ